MQGFDHPIFTALLEKRGIITPEDREVFFFPDYDKHLHSPFLFSEMEAVVERVETAIRNAERVGVFGDFDADGVTGSAILREGLETLGLDTRVYIPDKNAEGHGVSIPGMEYFLQEGVTLVFTVDCGISNYDEIAWAKEHGLDVIVIDHHHIPPVLPPAVASINPKMPESGYPFRDLCGAGTAFKVLQGVYRKLAPEKEDQLKWLLDLVAVGTVADCMPIVDENRVLVKYGLIVLAKTRRPGLQELYDVGRIRIGENVPAGSDTIGFSIAPRINAAGRMAHAKVAHELLVTQDRVRARELAETLEKYNRDRQKVTADITGEVKRRVAKEFADKQFILCAEPHYPLGIVGLVAGRVAEEFGKPTAILSRGEEESHGSFRSIPGVSVIEALEECREMLIRYGGHEQAAGMIIRNDRIEEFYETFHTIVQGMMETTKTAYDQQHITDDALNGEEADGTMLTVEFARALKSFEPFGIGNEEPRFLFRKAVISDMRFVGNGEKHLKMILEVPSGKQKRYVDAIGFNLGGKEVEWVKGARVDVSGHIQENIWNGKSSVQIMVREIRQATSDI